ncbi:MAG: hypothetical protein ABR589_12025 [Chthoniobacterales bacterium]
MDGEEELDPAGFRLRGVFVFFAGRGRDLRFAAFDLPAAAALRFFNAAVTAVTTTGTAAATTAAVILPMVVESFRAMVAVSQIRRRAATLYVKAARCAPLKFEGCARLEMTDEIRRGLYRLARTREDK